MNRRDEEIISIVTVALLAAIIAYAVWDDSTSIASVAPPAQCYWTPNNDVGPNNWGAIIGNSSVPKLVSDYGYVFPDNTCNDNTPVYWAMLPTDCTPFGPSVTISCLYGNNIPVGPQCASAVGHPNANCIAGAFQFSPSSSSLVNPLDGNKFYPASISIRKSY